MTSTIDSAVPHPLGHGNELKPCPFCGGPAEVLHFNNSTDSCKEWYVASCRLGNPCKAMPAVSGDTIQEAITIWNTRPDPA